MKPYYQIPIRDWGEPLVPIPLERFAVDSPHAYEKLGAPYGETSPYHLRQTVLEALITAQHYLQQQCPGWRILIFDAYRPVAVQEFMVNHTFAEVVRSQNLNPATLSESERQQIWQQVYKIWALPSPDPLTPPPHSTGAAVDITLVNHQGEVIDMGSAIDELSARSHPDYYAQALQLPYHAHRQLLRDIMQKAGFQRHPGEWWHFCCGDQMWAWLCHQQHPTQRFIARYGRVAGESGN
ncbi:MAG: M15 family metallopeptidase [Coleofasciculus sp. C1-SOL-03]|uniref:M15 family metallopeptidase n=1 Tax=Coleofasciculus sp. C1-SOL-03 TaxID=3069522 RepID=UPI0032F9CB83